jgi:hypothetical protein
VRLEYQIGVDMSEVRRALRGVEREFEASGRKTSRAGGSPMAGPGRKEFEAQRRVRERQERDVSRAAMALDRQRSNALLQQYRAAERERSRGERNAQAEAMRLDRQRASAARALDRQRAAGLMAEHRRQEAAARRAQSARERTGGAVSRGIARTVSGGVGTVARFGGAAASIAGGFLVADAMRTRMSEAARASQLANQAGTPALKGQLLNEAQGIRGFTGSEALEGLGSFVDVTGDLGAARALLKSMGDVALATSTDLSELGSAMGTAFIPLADQIKDPTERLKAMNAVMKATAGMGAVGAVEVKDLASEMAGLAATSSRFKGDAQENLNKMVAFAQAARQRGGASSAAEAVTSVQRFGSDLLTGPAQKRLNALGVNVFADKGRTQLKDPTDILVEVLTKTKGNLVQLNEIFGERGVRAVQGFSPLFTDAERKQKGSGGAVVRAEMDRLLNASVTDDQIRERVASRVEDPDIRFKEAMKVFNNEVGDRLLPVVTKSVGEFSKAVPAIARLTSAAAGFADWFLDNPIKGVGSVILAAVAKDAAGAGIGSALKNLVTSMLGGGVPATAGAGAAGSAKGALAATGAIIGVAAAVDQGADLTKASGGGSGVWAGIKGVFSGKGYAGGVDEFMNEKARRSFNDPLSPESFENRRIAAEQSGGALTAPAQELTNAARAVTDAAGTFKLAVADGARSPRHIPIVAR